jgi:hypothetical protein
MTLTDGVGRQRRRRHSRSTALAAFIGPHAASGGSMWNNAPPRFLQFQKSSSTIPAFFRGYFVNFNLFNVIFAQFLNFYNFQCESKKKKEKKKEKI